MHLYDEIVGKVMNVKKAPDAKQCCENAAHDHSEAKKISHIHALGYLAAETHKTVCTHRNDF